MSHHSFRDFSNIKKLPVSAFPVGLADCGIHDVTSYYGCVKQFPARFSKNELFVST